MYPIECAGHYAVPLKAGKPNIVQIMAAVDDLTKEARLMLVDDLTVGPSDKWGKMPANKTKDHSVLCDLKGVAGESGMLQLNCPDTMKVRNGISIIHSENIQPGSIFVYVR
jgi:hypothetical protein